MLLLLLIIFFTTTTTIIEEVLGLFGHMFNLHKPMMFFQYLGVTNDDFKEMPRKLFTWREQVYFQALIE